MPGDSTSELLVALAAQQQDRGASSYSAFSSLGIGVGMTVVTPAMAIPPPTLETYSILYAMIAGFVLTALGLGFFYMMDFFSGPAGPSLAPPFVYPPPCKGDDGDCGEPGLNGNQVYFGTGDPNICGNAPVCAQTPGDLFIDRLTRNLWQLDCSLCFWEFLARIGIPDTITGDHTASRAWRFDKPFVLGLTQTTGTGSVTTLPSTTPWVHVYASGTFSLDGIVAGVALGQYLVLTITNGAAATTTIDSESVTAPAANRIFNPSVTVLTWTEPTTTHITVTFMYMTIAALSGPRWIVVSAEPPP